MKAMVLCAGRGERLRPLTDHTPKPLATIGGETLLGRHLGRLAEVNIEEVIINVAHLGAQIKSYVGNGHAFGLDAKIIDEGQALETGGGILNALPLLGPQPFIVLNGDIWTDYPLAELPTELDALAHLVLVPNPPDKADGDFGLAQGTINNQNDYTYSGIAVFHPQLFHGRGPGKFSITPLLRAACGIGKVTGCVYRGHWYDIGSPERLTHARGQIAAKTSQ